MKKALFVLLLFVLSLPAFADSVSWNSNYGSESYTYTSGNYNYLYGYSYGTGSNNNWNEMEFYASGNNGSMSGWAYDYFYNHNDTKFTELYGSLSNGFFNFRTDTFRALFSGYDYTYNYQTGQWSDVYVNGVFTEHINFNPSNGQWSYGNLGNGSITTGCTTVPEPGTLAMMGTGLIGLAGVVRRKLKI